MDGRERERERIEQTCDEMMHMFQGKSCTQSHLSVLMRCDASLHLIDDVNTLSEIYFKHCIWVVVVFVVFQRFFFFF